MSVVDIHAHYVSPDLVEAAARNGAQYGIRVEESADGKLRLVIAETPPLRPIFAELSDLRLRLPLLAAQGIGRQVISTWTDLAGDELGRDEAARWSRLQNDTLAAAAKTMADRFEAMATLPMQFPDLAVAELEYCVRTLGLRSVEIGTNIRGRDLDHESFRPIWRLLAELDVFILLHPPRVPVGMDRVGDYFLNNLIAYPVDTTIAAARLVFSGILHTYPGLKCCLAHGGGFLPYQIGRMDRGFAAHPACQEEITRAPSEYLRSFYYDTLTHHTPALDYLIGLVGADKVIYGSDYPFEMLDETGPERVRQVEGLTDADRDAILEGNALGLLPAESRIASPSLGSA